MKASHPFPEWYSTNSSFSTVDRKGASQRSWKAAWQDDPRLTMAELLPIRDMGLSEAVILAVVRPRFSGVALLTPTLVGF